MASNWTRESAGYYTSTINGHSLEVESASRAIENGKGWVVWVDGRAPTAEYRTLSAAKSAAEKAAI